MANIKIEKGKSECKFEGKIEGKNERNIEIATQIIKDGEPNEKIVKYTGLIDEEINGLRENGVVRREL